MELRSGKIIDKFFRPENQPFKLILAPEKFHKVKKSNEVIIDFDESSKAWRKNKIHLGGGQFHYK
jgi:hypothetical protein